jgi:hypothetical protein
MALHRRGELDAAERIRQASGPIISTSGLKPFLPTAIMLKWVKEQKGREAP